MSEQQAADMIDLEKRDPNELNVHLAVSIFLLMERVRSGRDRMVVGFTTKVVSSNTVHGEVYSIQHYVIKFVNYLRQIGVFLRFPPQIKLTATM